MDTAKIHRVKQNELPPKTLPDSGVHPKKLCMYLVGLKRASFLMSFCQRANDKILQLK